MKCPVDGVELQMAERSGIEIDYCPQCRGVWLDRGELDKILERSAAEAPAARPQQQQYEAPRQAPPPRYEDERRYDTDRRYEDPRYGGKPHKKRRESFLDDLFDFG